VCHWDSSVGLPQPAGAVTTVSLVEAFPVNRSCRRGRTTPAGRLGGTVYFADSRGRRRAPPGSDAAMLLTSGEHAAF
jgi:hypothetical protein